MVTAFGVFWMTQYLEETVPDELIEAARVDGCSMIRTFWHVALPAAQAGRGDARPVHVRRRVDQLLLAVHRAGLDQPHTAGRLQLLQAAYFVDYALDLAGVVLATIPLILLFIVAGKQLVSGIMDGAVKG